MKIPILIGVLMLLGMVLLREMGPREVAAVREGAAHIIELSQCRPNRQPLHETWCK